MYSSSLGLRRIVHKEYFVFSKYVPGDYGNEDVSSEVSVGQKVL